MDHDRIYFFLLVCLWIQFCLFILIMVVEVLKIKLHRAGNTITQRDMCKHHEKLIRSTPALWILSMPFSYFCFHSLAGNIVGTGGCPHWISLDFFYNLLWMYNNFKRKKEILAKFSWLRRLYKAIEGKRYLAKNPLVHFPKNLQWSDLGRTGLKLAFGMHTSRSQDLKSGITVPNMNMN